MQGIGNEDSPSTTLASQEQFALARNSNEVTYVAHGKDDTQGAESPMQATIFKNNKKIELKL